MRVKNAVSTRFTVRAPLVAALVCASLALSGCATWRELTGPAAPNDAPTASADAGAQTTSATRLQKFLWVFSPYRPDIQQGNFISQEMLSQLKVGQTRDQVKFILGTPLLTDIFHADRWDYPFYLARGNGELTSSRVTVYFKDNVVAKFDGGNLPTEQEYIARIAGPSKFKKPAEAPKKEEAGSATIQINK
jgi:outer membrane protein assembly factor BamE